MNPFYNYSTPAATDQATTDSYVDVNYVDSVPGGVTPYIHAPTSGPISFHLKNSGANSIKYKVIGSNDRSYADADWNEVVAEATLAAAAVADEFVDIGRFLWYKLQAKAAVAGAQGAMKAAVVAKRF